MKLVYKLSGGYAVRMRQNPVTRRWFWRITDPDNKTRVVPTLRGGRRLVGFQSPFSASQAAEQVVQGIGGRLIR